MIPLMLNQVSRFLLIVLHYVYHVKKGVGFAYELAVAAFFFGLVFGSDLINREKCLIDFKSGVIAFIL